MQNLSEIIEFYFENGYAVIPQFLNNSEIDELKGECFTIIDDLDVKSERSVIFSTSLSRDVDDSKSDDYFMNSGDKIRYFYESNAFDKSGELIVDKYKCLNKVGHGLHWLNPVFKRYTFNDKVKDVVKTVGFVDPVVVQSMIIYKNAGIGGVVLPHQDATYLHTTPDIKVLGLWFAFRIRLSGIDSFFCNLGSL